MISAGLTTVGAYQAELAAAIPPLPPEVVGLDDADGTVLAEDITAGWPLPLYCNSAMDGYAVIARDLSAASLATPVTLPVEYEIPAGDTRALCLAPATCAKIMTGALVPAGADTIVRREWVSESEHKATFTRPPRPGESVRPTGSETQPGDLLLPAGTLLGPAQLALLAATGHPAVLARRRPRVTIMSAGSELISPGTRPLAGQTWESNGLMLAAAARRLGATPRRHPVIPDDHAAVLAAIQHALPGTDLLVTSGGISMGGEHDSFKAALHAQPGIRFCRVAMRPGMPQGFGAIGDPPVPILLLPGNPLSAFVSFILFAEPALRAQQAGGHPRLRTARAALTVPVTPAAEKMSFLSAAHDPAAGTVTPLGRSAHDLIALARANALIVLPPGLAATPAGSTVKVLRL